MATRQCKIMLAPTAELARSLDPAATVEAEYGNICVCGYAATLAHHGERSNNPAPCNWPACPILNDGDVIVVSHLDLDAIGGIAKLIDHPMGRGNTAFWEGLTDEERALIQECANEAYDDFIAQREATLQTRMDAIADSGTEIVEFTDDMRAPFKEIAEKNRDIFTKTCDDGQEVIDLFEKDFETMGLFK